MALGRTGLVLVGGALVVGVGYPLVYTAMTHLKPTLSPSGAEVGFIDAVIPGRLAACSPAPPPSSTGATGGGGGTVKVAGNKPSSKVTA